MAVEYETPPVELNLTPMIDVVFLLLIFFMLVSEIASLDSAQLSLPFASVADDDPKQLDQNRLIIVNVQKHPSTPGVGLILIQGRKYDKNGLRQYIQREAMYAGMEDPKKRISHLRVRIRADRDARTKAIQRIFEACQENGVYKTEISASKKPDDYRDPEEFQAGLR